MPAAITEDWLPRLVSSMWYAYRCSKGLNITMTRQQGAQSSAPISDLVRQIFHRWSSRCSFLRSQKETRKYGRNLKQQRFLGILEEAKSAIQNKNQHGLFRVVRSLAPKQRHSTMQVYGPGGELVSKNKEIDILRTHFSAVWRNQLDWKPPKLHTELEDHGGLIFTPPSVAEVCRAVETIRAHKAVPNKLPPAAIWKQHGATIGRAAHRITHTFWTEGGQLYPDSWHDTYLVLLQKPNKPQGVPSSLRPVGLQDPLAKAYTSLLTKKLTPYALSYLRNVPQFAYISGRDILGSLERAVRHCKQVRNRMKAGSYNLWSRRSGQARQDFTVGHGLWHNEWQAAGTCHQNTTTRWPCHECHRGYNGQRCTRRRRSYGRGRPFRRTATPMSSTDSQRRPERPAQCNGER